MHTFAASFLHTVPEGPPDPILGLAQAFREDPSESKVNLVVGAYRGTDGMPWVLPSVKEAERIMLEEGRNKEYASITGDAAFVQSALRFAYGKVLSSPIKPSNALEFAR